MRLITALLFVAITALAAEPQKDEPKTEEAAEQEEPATLLTVKRVFLDSLGPALGADEIRDMLAAALLRGHLFIITENEERADAFLRGTASDTIYQEEHESNDSITAHSQASNSHSSPYSGGANRSAGLSIGETEHSRSNERKHDALAAVRLVNRDGDVLWATTQESQGAKFRGPTADVAEKVAQALVAEVRQARGESGQVTRLKGKEPVPHAR